jgi:RNA polymerase sigma-70 factor, ECF subfamily
LKSAPSSPRNLLAESFGHAAASAVATLARIFGDLQIAEDAVQDAYVKALAYFQDHALPEDLSAWIFATARNGLMDRLRRETKGREKLALLARMREDVLEPDEHAVIADDRLNLIFTCCHPAISPLAQTALILRCVCGLSTARIAAALIEPEATVAQRLVRAKRKIAQARIPFVVPSGAELPARLRVALSVAYSIFNAGYVAPFAEDLLETDLCEEALYLARTLSALMPDEPEAMALHALLLFLHARRDARVTPEGDFVPLDRQDHRTWKHDEIAEGFELLQRALHHRAHGALTIEAAIAAEHVRAADFESVDWKTIAALYDRLCSGASSFAVAVNAAVAHGFAEGPQTALGRLAELQSAPETARYHYFHSARAWALAKLGRSLEAARAYERAIELCSNGSERAFLQSKLRELQ